MNPKKEFNKFFSTQLNTEQQKAVSKKDGSLLVIAGAGSGKTRVITARIINLIVNEEVNPESILALTFTNKAAKEMKERIAKFTGTEFKKKPTIGTFHSYCLQILHQNPYLINTPNFTILDADDQQQLLRAILKRNHLEKKITPKSLSYQISIKKNNYGKSDAQVEDQFFLDLYKAYEKEKSLSKALDFDDLLIEVYKLFDTNKDFQKSFHQAVRHILVDEYQDTNFVQHALLKRMSKESAKFAIDSLCAVGDEDQSIYSWRGATVDNILNFKKDFPKTAFVKIEQNYRSVQPILEIANKVIENNDKRSPKVLWSDKRAQDRARIITCISGYQEGDAIAQCIKAVEGKHTLKSIALLYRAHYQSRIIEESLLRASIPYKIIGGIQFYERKEIKDILAYLRLVSNPFDRVSFFRVLNIPTRGLGPKFEEQCYELWSKEPLLSFHDLLKTIVEDKIVTGKKASAIKEFIRLFSGIEHMDKPTKVINHFVDKLNYFIYLQSSYDRVEADAKMDNIKELLRAVAHFEEIGIDTVSDFLAEVALMQEKISSHDQDSDFVQLMTLHAAKGLEFDTVVLSGLEEGVFPSSRSIADTNAIEEERRLFYVGITRAKDRLILTHSRYRYTYGSMNDQIPSRFLKEIPTQLAQSYDGSHWNSMQYLSFFTDWFGIKKPTDILTFGTATKSKASSSSTSPSSSSKAKVSSKDWKKNQPVKHSKFGMGIIKEVEEKDDTTIYITAEFKVGHKKIKANYLQKV